MQDILEETFCCPITSQLFIDPVVAQDGHTYEKATILSWLQKNNTSPLTRQPILLQNIRPNKAVKGIIDQFRKIEKNKIDIPVRDAFADKFSQQLDQLKIREDFKKFEKVKDQCSVEGFICPLTKLIFSNPVVAADGQTYEKRNIEEWMKINQNSPTTKSKFLNTMLYENRPIKRAIQFVKKDQKDRKQLNAKQRQLFNLFAPKIRNIIEQQLQKLDKNAANELLQNWDKADKEIQIIGRQDLIKKQLQLDSFTMKDEKLYFQMSNQTSLFVGRKRQLCLAEDLVKKNNIVCIVGAAGMGKSDFTRKYLNSSRAKSIIWFHAENKMINYQIIGYLQKVHKIIDIDQKDTQKLMNQFFSKVSKDAFIIFDSVDNLASIQQYLPRNNIWKIIITSRFKGWQFPKIQLNELEEKDYFLLLQNNLGKDQFEEAGKHELELYKLLGGIPLALQQAITYLKSNQQITISEYSEQFKKTHLQQAEDKKMIDNLNPAYVSLIITLHRMRKQNNFIDIILTVIGYISPSQLQKDFSMRFLESREKTPFTKNKSKKIKQTFRLLSQYSIISQDQKNENIYRINELFQSAIRMIHKKNGSFKKYYAQLFSWTLEQLYYSEPNHADVERVSKLIPHALALCKIQNTDQFKEKVDMWRQIGYHQLHSKHNYQFAKYCLLEAFKISRNNTLQQKSTYIDILNDLGCCSSGLNDHTKQQQYLTKALSISQKIFGYNHEKTAQVLTNLGEGYGHLGYFEKQRDVLQRALAIKMRILKQQGRNANISKCLTNLATAYGNLKNFKKKKQVLINALKISQQAYGPYNKDTMTVRMNLGNALRELGQKQRCLKELQTAQNYFISAFGADHPLTVLASNNLACAMMTFKCDMKEKKQLNEESELQAEHFMKQYGQIAITMLSKNPQLLEKNNNSNPNIPKQQNIKLLNYLGKQSYNAKKYQQAVSFFTEALKLSQKKWGKDHQNLGEVLIDLGNVYNLMDKYDKSFPLLMKSLQINRKYKGNKHYLTAIALTNLGGAYCGLKQYVKYRQVSEEAASIFAQTHGEKHQWTQDALYNISHAKRYIQKYVK